MIKWLKRFGVIAWTLGVFLCASPAMADSLEERPGARDHPLISRYAGSILHMYGDDNYGTAELVVIEKGRPAMRPLEGRISNKYYLGPKDRSPLEIFRNYQGALRTAGFETLLACETAQCDKLDLQRFIEKLPTKAKWQDGLAFVQRMFNNGEKPFFHFISARKTAANGMVHVQIALVGTDSGRTAQLVQIIESAQVEDGKVAIDAKAIGNSLKRDGKIALYGIHFDTNKSVVKAESGHTLEEMAKTLKAEPGLSVYIVGHTDNQGADDANVTLSQKRAEAVADMLVKQYGIAGARLRARGVANFSPVARNLDEDGRAKNRRVEMVVR